MEEKVQFELNGKQVEAILGRNETLLWALRTQFNLTGTKYGCGEGRFVRSLTLPVPNTAAVKVFAAHVQCWLTMNLCVRVLLRWKMLPVQK